MLRANIMHHAALVLGVCRYGLLVSAVVEIQDQALLQLRGLGLGACAFAVRVQTCSLVVDDYFCGKVG